MGKVCCEVCKKRCKGNVLKANEKYFHEECFKCSDCKRSLKTGGFFTRSDKYYCQKDFQKLSAPKCKICGDVLKGDIVSALAYSFHKGCFVCCQCKTPFNPGNRVTVWKDEFYCICCSESLSTACRQVSDHKEVISTTSLQSQYHAPIQPRLSFADRSSPVTFSEGIDDKTTIIHKASNGSILKPSLRQSQTSQPVSTGYNGGGPDVTGRLRPQNVSATLPVESFQDQLNPDFTPHSCTFGPQHSRSLHASARHPFSEYGRFYNLSYASIADQPSRRSTDAYRRNGLHTPATSNSTSHVQHFHIPQGKRFSLEPNRIIPAGMSRISRSFNSSLRNALANMNELVIRKVVPVSSQYASTGILYSSPRVASNISNKRSTLNENLDASLEARRLASFPSGQPPDETFVPAIERYDWPAPASTAVMTSEMMRERRQRLREQGVLHDNSEESIEDLSIDASVGSHSELDRTSGIERAILVERERALQEKARALRAPDPVSSSRSPNAKVEPPYKTRYTTHNFASPSREIQRNSVSPHRLGYSLELVNLGNRVWPASVQSQCRPNHQTASHNVSALRPGYIAGQLSVASTNSSTILGSHLSSFRDASHSNDYKNEAIQGEDSRPRVNGCDSIQSYLSPTCVNGLCVNGDALYSNRDFGSSLLASSPSVICSPAPYDLATKQDAPSKEIAYKDLVTSLGRQPRGIDRTRLEMYLSNAEFENVFKISRVAFYRLPEWKRNDLKRRVNLF